VFYQYLDTSEEHQETDDNLVCCVQKIIRYVEPISHDERAINVKNRFLNDPGLLCIPVLKNGRVVGLINRHRFMENHMVGRYGFGHNLNYYKHIETLLDDYRPSRDARRGQPFHPETVFDDRSCCKSQRSP